MMTCLPTSPRINYLVHSGLCIKNNLLWATASTISPPTYDNQRIVQGITSTTSSTNTSLRMTQEWTRFELCCFVLLLRLRQEGAAQVDTTTTPSPVQVHRHRILFVV